MDNNNIKELQELQKLTQDHIVRAGQTLLYGSKNKDVQAAKRAEKLLREGLTKLKKMDLSPENSRNIRLLRKALEYAIESARALQRCQYDKAEKLMQEASDYGYKYSASVLDRASNL